MSATKEKGTLSVNTDDLFPIIKKWLYSEHDIFLREIISNAFDACQKIERLSDLGKYDGKVDKALINIQIDKPKKTITVSDNGIGMTEEEVKKYINQIAFSGAKDFLEKYKGGNENEQIIGHFGLGFFSTFMVAKNVEIETKSFQENSEAVHWECDGHTEFTMSTGSRKERGTDIILHLNSESEEFLDENKIRDMVKRYSAFLPADIQINGKSEDELKPLWDYQKNKLKDEDYKEFYNKLFPGYQEPLFWVHFSVDHPFRLKGILFFPKLNNDLELRNHGRIKLFCNKVFVSDNIIDIIPQYLNLLQGVIDSPDIPLNVSRSFLQGDPKIKKIGEHIVAKVASKLTSLYKKDKEKYIEYWKDISSFIKFGVINDEKFFQKMKDGLIYTTTDGKTYTLDEYKNANEKAGDKVFYTSDPEGQISYINSLKEEGVEVVVMDQPLDNHFMQQMEMKASPVKFVRVDSGIGEELLEDDKKDESSKEDKEKEPQEKEPQEKELCELFKHHTGKENLEVTARAFKDASFTAMITQQEFMRRFNDMSSLMQGKIKSGLMDNHNLTLNLSNPLIQKIKNLSKEEADSQTISQMCKDIYDLALIQQGALKGDQLYDFVKRTNNLLEKAIKNES